MHLSGWHASIKPMNYVNFRCVSTCLDRFKHFRICLDKTPKCQKMLMYLQLYVAKFFHPAPVRLHYRHWRFLYHFAPLHANTALAFLRSNGCIPSWSQEHTRFFIRLGDNLEVLMLNSSSPAFAWTSPISISFSPVIILTLSLILTVDD